MRALALTLLLLLPVSAAALDCTPFQNWTCAQNGFVDYVTVSSIPGEVVCGVDYTGWLFHVVEFTADQPGYYGFSATTAKHTDFAGMVYFDTAVMVMDDCSAGTCLASAQSLGGPDLGVCLNVGTYTVIVASYTTDPDALVNMGATCPACVDVIAAGIDCPYCGGPVNNDETAWGSLKAQYR